MTILIGDFTCWDTVKRMVICQQSVKLDQISFIILAHSFDSAHIQQNWKMQAGKTIRI